MTQVFTQGTKNVTTTETEIFTPVIEVNYFGVYLFIGLMTTNDIIVKQYVWNNVRSVYELFETPLTQTGQTNDTVKFIPLLPLRRFRLTVQRTSGVGANTNYDIDFDIVTQSG
jgi:hypothetical protein